MSWWYCKNYSLPHREQLHREFVKYLGFLHVGGHADEIHHSVYSCDSILPEELGVSTCLELSPPAPRVLLVPALQSDKKYG